MIGKYIQNPLKKLNIDDSWVVGGEIRFLLLGLAEKYCDFSWNSYPHSSCASELKSNEGRTVSIGIAALCVRMISTFLLIHADVNPSGSQ